MTQQISKDIEAWKVIDTQVYPEPEIKKNFHRLGKKILKQLAQDLNLPAGSYEIRSCLGGPAIWGDITLHAERIYIKLMEPLFLGSTQRVMYRTCKGRKDYSGGSNEWCSIDGLMGDRIPEIMRAMAHGGCHG